MPRQHHKCRSRARRPHLRRLKRAATFDDFTPDNDPYGEHDFGSFELCSRKFFWKIELYEEPGVKDKNGEPVVTRVLTIMLAHEY